MRIEAGDFPKGTHFSLGEHPMLCVPTGMARPRLEYVELEPDSIASLELISDNAVKNTGGAVGGAIVGGVLLGPVGAVGGALMGGSKREVTFALELKDGRRLLAVATPEEWTKLRNAMF